MPNATTFWNSLGGNGADATCQALPANGTTATCNGNGNGLIAAAVISNDETTRLWQHLVNAALIEGSYTGTYGGTPVAGTNFPASKLGNSTYWYAGSTTGVAGSPFNFTLPAGTAMQNTGWSALALSGQEAWNIDMKMDNGMPAHGKVISFKGNVTFPCTSAVGVAPPADASATYNLTDPGKFCYNIFSNTF